MERGPWVINLDEAQSKAMKEGELKYMRFPTEIYENNFSGPKNILLKDCSSNITSPAFYNPREETMSQSAKNMDVSIGEGTFYHEDSYEERWNKRFPDNLYSKNLDTVVIELTWNI